MKTLLEHQRSLVAAVAIVLLSMVCGSVAQAKVSAVVLSEDFSEGYVPPPGWNSDNYSWGGSYWSSAGAGDYNGSWVFDIWDCNYDYIYSPSIDLSGSTGATDKVTLDFDMYMEYNYYDESSLSWGAPSGGAQFQVMCDNSDGNFWSNVLADFSFTTDYYTYNSGADYQIYDPDVNSGSWRHYTIDIPANLRTSQFRLVFFAQAYWNCNGGNVAFDNVVVTATKPQLVNFAPTNIGFGALAVGLQSASQCVTLTNTSSADVAITSAILAGTNASDFVITGPVPSVIPADGNANICVAFKPTDNGPLSAKLVINNGSDNNPEISVDLTGTGLAPLINLIPVGAHNTSTKMFYQASMRLGDTLEQMMLIQNVGSGNLHITGGTSISGSFPSEYFISQLPAVGGIPAGQIDTIKVKYTPTIEGRHTATLTITSDAANGPQVVALSGTGILPKIVVTPNPLRFDSTKVGDTVCTSLTVYNPGSDTLKLKNQIISSTEGDFLIGLLTQEFTSIPPDRTRQISVCFVPKQVGSREASLTLFTNIPFTFETKDIQVSDGDGGYITKTVLNRRDTGTVKISISGTGVPYGSLAVSAGRGGLDSTIVGTQVCRVDTIWNFGSADITVKSLVISGTDKNDFTFSGITLPFVVHAKSYKTITVCATPSARGLRQALLTTTATTADKNLSATLSLGVYGQLVCASTAPQALFIDTKVVKSTDSVLCVQVTNCGDIATTYTAHISDTTYYHVTPSTSILVQPGLTADFCVHFNPTATGEQDAKLVISAPNLADESVDLKGIGACANLTAAAITVPTTNAGGHSSFPVTINNVGNLDYTLGTPVLTQSDSAYWIMPTPPALVAASGNVQIMIGYDPSKISTTYSAELSFPNGGPCTEAMPKITWTNTTGTEGVALTTVQAGYSLDQNYPNPTTGTTSFHFTTPREANVTVTLSDLTGYTVRTLINGRVSEGTHIVTLDGSGLASGTYIYTLQSEGVRLSRMLVLTK